MDDKIACTVTLKQVFFFFFFQNVILFFYIVPYDRNVSV